MNWNNYVLYIIICFFLNVGAGNIFLSPFFEKERIPENKIEWAVWGIMITLIVEFFIIFSINFGFILYGYLPF